MKLVFDITYYEYTDNTDKYTVSCYTVRNGKLNNFYTGLEFSNVYDFAMQTELLSFGNFVRFVLGISNVSVEDAVLDISSPGSDNASASAIVQNFREAFDEIKENW
jgi:hypothetical protein